MGLDVYLYRKRWTTYNQGKTFKKDLEEVYTGNVTHNLGPMAEEAGIYTALWKPEDIKAKKAKDISKILSAGLKELKKHPSKYIDLNPENGWGTYEIPSGIYGAYLPPKNGWGTYEGLVNFVENYLKACKKYPEAMIEVCR